MLSTLPKPHIPVPTLPTPHPSVTGTSCFRKPMMNPAWETAGDNLFIDDLVQGVQQCQDAAKRAGEMLKRQKDDAQRSAQSRAKSPVPVPQRKPWGANVASSSTPRSRPTTTTSPSPAATPPSTQKKRVSNSPQKTATRAVSPAAKPVAPLVTSSTHRPPKKAEQPRKEVVVLEPRVQELEERLASMEERNSELAQKLLAAERTIVALQTDHNMSQMHNREKFLQLTAQVQYALQWVTHFDAVVHKATQEDELPTFQTVVSRKLNLSGDSGSSKTPTKSISLPPAPPLVLFHD